MTGTSLDRLAPEFRLLCLASRRPLRPKDAAELAALIADGPDWSASIDGAQRHRVAARVLKGLQAPLLLSLSAGPPPDVLATLHAQVKVYALRSLNQVREIDRLFQALAAAGIRALALKGVALSLQLYDQVALRQPGDIDVLVDPQQFWEADAVLPALGYRRDGGEPTPRFKAAYARWGKELRYYKPGHMVELHQRLSENPLLLACDFDRLWRGRGTAALGEIRIDTLDRRFLALYLCVHGAGHCWERLAWLVDLAALLSDPAAQTAALDDALAAGLEHPMRLAAHLAHDWLALPLTDPRLKWDDQGARRLDRFVRRYSPGSGGGLSARYGSEWRWRMQIHHRLERYRLKSGWRYRLRQFAGEMVTPLDWLSFPLPDQLFWLYPLLRPVGWLIRHWRQFFQRGNR